MSRPTQADWEMLVRLGRYLKGKPRTLTWYKFQRPPGVFETQRRRLGRVQEDKKEYDRRILDDRTSPHQHVVQNPSNPRAQLGGCRVARVTLGLVSLGRGLGTSMSRQILGDASAALANVQRQEVGKLRHVDTQYPWIQEKADRKELEYGKVKGVENNADVSTKALTWEAIQVHLLRLGTEMSESTAEEKGIQHVGETPAGVLVGKALHSLGFQTVRGLEAWTRKDLGSATTRTTVRGGPAWSQVVARITSRSEDGQILLAERAEDICRALEQARLSGGPGDIKTTLVYAADGIQRAIG